MYCAKKHAFETALNAADVAEVRRLARSIRDVQEPWTAEETVKLFSAAVHGGPAAGELLGCLLTAGFDPNTMDDSLGEDYCKVPLALAVGACRLDLVETLAAAGADIQWRSPTGATLMSYCWPSRASQEPRPDTPESKAMCDWLTAHGVTLDVHSRDSRRRLYWAAYSPRSWADVFAYLELGFDPDVVGWPSCMMDIAAGRATAEQARALTEEELDYRDTHGRTPFLLAVQGGHVAVAQAIVSAHPHRLRESKDEYRPCALHLAAQENLPAMLEWLVQQGLEVDFCTRPGDTALRTAVRNGHLEAARMLIRLGADIHVRDEFGGMLHSAGSFETMKLLIECGAEVNDVDNCGEWPLKTVCASGDAAHVRWLLEHGAKPDLTSTGATALFAAVRSGSIPCVELLLQAGANVNAQDCDDWTCLFHVGSVAMAEFLLARGADPSIPDQCRGLPEKWHGVTRAVRLKFRKARLAAKR